MRQLKVSLNRRLTYRDLARWPAPANERWDEWMRGLAHGDELAAQLMSALKADDAILVLALWRETPPQDPTSADKAQEIQK
jgi:hypothetical protein